MAKELEEGTGAVMIKNTQVHDYSVSFVSGRQKLVSMSGPVLIHVGFLSNPKRSQLLL